MAVTIDGTKGTTTPGLYSSTTFTGTYADGIVVDYTTGMGRISVGTSDGIAFYNAGIATTELMRIASSGNVGIGTNSPSYKLDVTSSVRFGAGTGQAVAFINGANSGSNNGAAVYFQNAGTTNFAVGNYSAIAGGAYSSDALYYLGSANNHIWSISGSEKMRIDTSGNVLIGSTSVGYARFETVRADTGNVGVGRFLASAASGYTGEAVQIIATQAGGTGFNLLSCYYSGGAAYAFKVRGDGTIYAQNTTVQSASDARFKENIVDSTEGLNVVSALRPVRFDIKEGHGVSAKTNQLGFIAQEVKAVFPDAVDVWGESDDPENPYLSLGSAALIPVLVKAIQEQQAIIEQLRADVAQLKGTQA